MIRGIVKVWATINILTFLHQSWNMVIYALFSWKLKHVYMNPVNLVQSSTVMEKCGSLREPHWIKACTKLWVASWNYERSELQLKLVIDSLKLKMKLKMVYIESKLRQFRIVEPLLKLVILNHERIVKHETWIYPLILSCELSLGAWWT